MIEYIGWIGAVLFGLCACPQTIKTVRTKSAGDLSWGFLTAWTGGEVCMIAYNHATINSLQLSVNYYFNLACLLPILWVKLIGGKKEYTDDIPAQYPRRATMIVPPNFNPCAHRHCVSCCSKEC